MDQELIPGESAAGEVLPGPMMFGIHDPEERIAEA
jgi:hypothetical protein